MKNRAFLLGQTLLAYLLHLKEAGCKARSQAQQKFMGMVHAVQKGEMPPPSPEVAQAAKKIPPSVAKDYASTKRKNLPPKKKQKKK